ncbi:MAG: hypothetical protein JWQ03_547 [Variovorax sp.]|nr:hypothetical protein [Variovorax sp.]
MGMRGVVDVVRSGDEDGSAAAATSATVMVTRSPNKTLRHEVQRLGSGSSKEDEIIGILGFAGIQWRAKLAARSMLPLTYRATFGVRAEGAATLRRPSRRNFRVDAAGACAACVGDHRIGRNAPLDPSHQRARRNGRSRDLQRSVSCRAPESTERSRPRRHRWRHSGARTTWPCR